MRQARNRDGDRPIHLVLVGLMGAGKTTVGEACARRLERPFVDTDAVVETLAGMTVAELFRVSGEDRFRALERQVVADACATPAPAVIACGGGAPLHADNRRVLSRCGYVVWLNAPPQVLQARIGPGTSRPLLPKGPASAVATLERLSAVRAGAYEAVADATIATEERDVDEVAGAIVAMLPT
jgi:shikimate kinase